MNNTANTYKSRITDKLLDFKLKSKGAVVITGAKWCGKTTSARQFAKSVMEFGDGVNQNQNIQFATINTAAALRGDTPRLFDEWQEVPALWDAVRYEVDRRNAVGQFILTGSTVPLPKVNPGAEQFHHTGTGRYSYLHMRPMSLYESGESNGQVSLGELFASPDSIAATSDLTLEQIAFVVCRGGWPFATFLEGDYALVQARDYYEAIISQDVSRIDKVGRNPQVIAAILRSYARNQGSQVALAEIARDADIDPDTARNYINALNRIYAVEDAAAWNPNVRSRTAIRTAGTRYFVDPSLATATLHLSPSGLLGDLRTFGFIFETLCVRDLRVYLSLLDGQVLHYRDKNGLECDAVAVLPDGRYGLIEVKLGQDQNTVDMAAEHLISLKDKIDTDKMPAPSFMMLLTANGTVAYKRPEDNVFVVPIGCLKD